MEKLTRSGLALCLVFAAAARAQAEPREDQAKARFKAGAELYDQNNLRGALAEFQRAYELSPSWKLLFNIGQVEMELHDHAGALKAFTRYLREGGADVPPSRATAVQADLERLRARVGTITLDTRSGAEVVIDAVAVGYAPLPEPIVVNAGRHEISVHIAGHEPLTRAVDIAGLQQVTVTLGNDLVPPAGSAPRDQPARPPSKLPMYVAWSAAGVFGAGAAVMAVVSYRASNDLDNLRSGYPVTRTQIDHAHSRLVTASAFADGFAAAAVIAGGLGLYWKLSRSHAAPAAERRVEFHLGPTGAFVAGAF